MQTNISFISKILSGLEGVKLARSKFLLHLFEVMLGLRGRYNFTHLSRYMGCTDKTIRQHYDAGLDFLGLNLGILKSIGVEKGLLAFDCSFVRKAGKKTWGLDWFYSSEKNAGSKGLEIGTLALVDQKRQWAFNLKTFQTPKYDNSVPKESTRMDFYIESIKSCLPKLKKMASHIAVDGFFYKKGFISAMVDSGLPVITKMRKDADMYYLYTGPQKPKGRKRKKDGKVNWAEPDYKRFKTVWICADYELLEAELYSVRLKRKLKVCMIRQCKKSIPTNRYALLCSTDLELSAKEIQQYYSLRFQIEFCFRDAKQHCGLQHCQSRKEERLDFHFNASMTTLNIAKALEYQNTGQPFSMASVKTRMANKYMIKRFITNLELNPNCEKIIHFCNQFIPLGSIAA